MPYKNKYDNRCNCCGFSDERALQIDHINGNGHKEREEFGYVGLQKRVLANPKEYQLLCANCNWIKRAEEGESPCHILK